MKRLVKLAVSLVIRAYDVMAAGVLKLTGRKPPATCVVLYYHGVPTGQRRGFAIQMDCLLRHARPVPAGHQAPLEPGHHYAAVTFDDGFTSVIQNALPELRSRGIPASIFVATGSLGQSPTWIKDPGSPGKSETVLSAAELKGLNGTPLLSIGSHSVTHPNLAKSEPSRARAELVESKSMLESILGAEVTLFSFPHGAHNERLLQQAKEAGYRRVFTITPRLAFVGADEFCTGRTAVGPTDWGWEFSLKLLGAYRWLSTVSAVKRKLQQRSPQPTAV